MRKFTIHAENGEYVQLSAPLKIYYDLTTDCNLDCIFCFKGGCEKKSTLEEAKRVIDKVADANVMDIVFLGGEPLVCPYLFEALEYATACGINPGIITNGTLFTDENAKLLKKLVNNSISVSVHAHTSELHDQISRGNDVLKKIIQGLHILNKHDIKPEISFTPVKQNINYLYDTVSNILDQGIQVSDLLVNRLIPAGNAVSAWKDKEVTLDGQKLLFTQMGRLSADYPELLIATGDAIPFCMVDSMYWKYIVRCDYAITLGWINENNLFGKCMCRGSKGFDSLDNKTIRELWKTSDTFLDHRCLKSIPDECRSCDWLASCGGGCACSSYDKTQYNDAYLDKSLRVGMPPYKKTTVNRVSSRPALNCNSHVTLKTKFIIRKEHEPKDNMDEVYLFIPLSSGAIIQDVISPEEGDMLWVSNIEKQVILYSQLGKNVDEIKKMISYEFALSNAESLSHVINTLCFLMDCDMVSVNEL